MADVAAGLEPVLTDPVTLWSAALPAQNLIGLPAQTLTDDSVDARGG